MKASISILAVMFLAWYVAVGTVIADAAKDRISARCAGHRHAHDRWPVAVKVFDVVGWPMGAVVGAVSQMIPDNQLVCDRFD